MAINFKDKNGNILNGTGYKFCATDEQVQKAIDNRIEDGTISGGIGGQTGSDTLLGTLPYLISETGCYLLSSSDVTVKSGDGGGSLVTNVTPNPNLTNTSTISNNTGNAFTLSTGTLYCDITGKVEAGKTYTIMMTSSAGGQSNYVRITCGNSKTSPGNIVVQLSSGNSNELSYITFTMPDSFTYANIVFVSASERNISDFYLLAGTYTSTPKDVTIQLTANTPYSTDLLVGMSLNVEGSNIVKVYKLDESKINNFSSKTYLCFSDSIWAFKSCGGDLKITDKLSENIGAKFLNLAVQGTRMTPHTNETYIPYSMCVIADAIASGDFSEQINKGQNNNYTKLSSINLGQIGGIIICFGTNDYANDRAFTSDGTVNTVCGALEHTLETILTQYPTMKIFVVSTLPYINIGTPHVNPNGSVRDMNVAIETTCKNYGIPFINMLDNFGSNDITRSTFHGDGVHLKSPTGGIRYCDVFTAQFLAKTRGCY